jgi:lipid-binding SYLF domain-containing protein
MIKYLAVLCLTFVPLHSKAAANPNQAVERAVSVINEFRSEGIYKRLPKIITNSNAIIIIPRLIKGGFFFGAENGTGLLLLRNKQTNIWSSPTFLNITGGGFGLQFGVESSEVIVVIQTQKALDAVLQNQFTFGAGAGLSIGHIGADLGADISVKGHQDIYIFSRSRGLFAGIALKGSIIKPARSLNEDYYQKTNFTQDDIWYLPTTPAIQDLHQALNKLVNTQYDTVSLPQSHTTNTTAPQYQQDPDLQDPNPQPEDKATVLYGQPQTYTEASPPIKPSIITPLPIKQPESVKQPDPLPLPIKQPESVKQPNPSPLPVSQPEPINQPDSSIERTYTPTHVPPTTGDDALLAEAENVVNYDR